jgi:hypothetical protein
MPSLEVIRDLRLEQTSEIQRPVQEDDRMFTVQKEKINRNRAGFWKPDRLVSNLLVEICKQ